MSKELEYMFERAKKRMCGNCGKDCKTTVPDAILCKNCFMPFCSDHCRDDSKILKRHKKICSKFRRMYNEEISALENKDLKKNGGKYDPKLNDLFWKSYLDRGLAYLRLKNHENALKDFSKYIEINPEIFFGYFNRGLCHMFRKEYKMAIENFNKSISLRPTHQESYINRGVSYTILGEFKNSTELYRTAIVDLTEAIRIQPTGEGYYSRANAFIGIKEHEKAIKDLTRAIEITHEKHPRCSLYFSRRGDCYLASKDFKNALNDFQKALRLDPGNANAIHHISVCYYELGEYEKAVEASEKVLRMTQGRKSSVFAYRLRGNIDARMGNLEGMKKHYGLAEELEKRFLNPNEQKAVDMLTVLPNENREGQGGSLGWQGWVKDSGGRSVMFQDQGLEKNPNERIRFCAVCGLNKRKMKKCGRCRSRYYCSPSCQKKDWRNHKLTCKPAKK